MDTSPKYPRTKHFPWSLGVGSDDKIQKDISFLLGKEIVVTEKMDGSNVTCESDACYARTHSGPPTHPSFDAFKQLHSSIKYQIPRGWQLCGEWLYAKHSIHYTSLPNYLMIFGVRETATMRWLDWSWVETCSIEFNIPTVPVLETTVVKTEAELKALCEKYMSEKSICGGEREGIVIRSKGSYHTDDFGKNTLKCVRPNHVQSNDEHWKKKIIIKNELKISSS